MRRNHTQSVERLNNYKKEEAKFDVCKYCFNLCLKLKFWSPFPNIYAL